jgi:hypothetical protein
MTVTTRRDNCGFMSPGLLRSVRLSRPYLHSPADDLESFYYIMQWAAVHNDGSGAGKRSRRYPGQVPLLIHRIRPNNLKYIQKFGAFLAGLQLVLKDRYPSILTLIRSCRTVKDVANYLKIVRKHREPLK